MILNNIFSTVMGKVGSVFFPLISPIKFPLPGGQCAWLSTPVPTRWLRLTIKRAWESADGASGPFDSSVPFVAKLVKSNSGCCFFLVVAFTPILRENDHSYCFPSLVSVVLCLTLFIYSAKQLAYVLPYKLCFLHFVKGSFL